METTIIDCGIHALNCLIDSKEGIPTDWDAPQQGGMIVLSIFLTSWVVTRIYKNGIAVYWRKLTGNKFFKQMRRD